MHRKTVLIAPILFVFSICLFAPTAFALPPSQWTGVGSAFMCQGDLGVNMGQAYIYINYPDTILVDGHTINLNNAVWTVDYASGWGYFWNITQKSLLPNGYILVRAVPLTINAYIYAKLFRPGPCNIIILISPPITNPKSVHFGMSSINLTPVYGLSLKFAYFYGWGTSSI